MSATINVTVTMNSGSESFVFIVGVKYLRKSQTSALASVAETSFPRVPIIRPIGSGEVEC